MKQNIGNIDRIIRLVIATTAAYLYFSGVVSGMPGLILVFVAAIFILTSLIRFCPLYTLFGLSTCPAEKHS